MKYEILIDEVVKCELPGNLNKEKLADFLKIYLFNDEYQDWETFKIVKIGVK